MTAYVSAQMIEAARAEGIARERAAVLAVAEPLVDVRSLLPIIERGDHHPEHADALTRRDERVRAEVLAECTAILVRRAKEDREQARGCFRRGDGHMGRFLSSRADDCDIFAGQMQDLGIGDALKRMLTEAREAGRREERAAWQRMNEEHGVHSESEVARREREAAAEALEDALASTPVIVMANGTRVVSTALLRQRAASLRTPAVEGGGES